MMLFLGLFLRGYIPGFDGMRALAALSVMGTHIYLVPGFELGWTGVNCFYVMSGFLITGILLSTREDAGYFRTFYARRVLRIFPVYYLVVIVILAFGIATRRGVSDFPYFAAYVQNIAYATKVDVRFPVVAAHTWTLAIEEQFYVVWPLLVWALSRKALARVCVGLIALAPIARVVAGDTLSPLGFMLTPCQLDMLAWGALGAIVWPQWRGRLEKIAPASAVAFALLIALLVSRHGYRLHTALMFSTIGTLPGSIFYALFGPLFLAVLVIAQSGGTLTRLLEVRALRYLGRISYGLYLYHFPLYRAVDLLPVNDYAGVAIKVGGTMLIAGFSYALIERPLLKIKDRSFPPSANAPVERLAF